jgi:PAS domain S-box-containing protein
MKVFRSISAQIMLVVLLTVITVLAVSSIIELNRLKQRETRILQENGSLTADRVANSLAYPLWNLSQEETERVVLDELGSPDIYRVQVFDEDGSLYVGKIRGADGTIRNIDGANQSAPNTPNASFYSFSREINFKNTRIGSVTLEVTDANLRAELASQRREIAIRLLLLIAVLSVVLLLALRALVIRPISVLKSWVANIPSGKEAPSPRFKLSGEVNSLAEAFSDMSAKLREKNAELESERQRLQELNAQMKAEIEERKRTEEALRGSEERFAKIFNLSPHRMGIFRLKDGVVLQINDTWVREFGFQREEIVNRSIFEWSSWVADETMEWIRHVLASGKSVRNVEGHLKTKAGKELYILISTEVVELDGEPCLIWASNDISERKRAEEALQASERRFYIAFNSSPVPASITTLEDGRFLAVNDQFVNLTGFSRDEVIGHTSLELRLVTGETRARAVERLKKEGHLRDFEGRWRLKNGRERIMLQSFEKIELEGQLCLLQAAIDITERKQAEEALRESETRFRAMFEDSGSSMALVDMQGHPVKCNPALQKMLGYTEEELSRMAFTEFTHPDDRELDWGLYGELIAGERDKYEIEKRFIRKDGRIIWGSLVVSLVKDEDGAPKYAVGMVQDITERKAAEEALRRSEENFRKAFEASPAPGGIIRARDRQHLKVNSAFARTLGYTAEEVVGKTAAELGVWPDGREQEEFWQKLPKKKSVQGYETRIYTKSGEMMDVLLYVEAIELSGEQYFMASIIDITERKQAEEKLKASSVQLRALSESLRKAKEEESIRIARELHDELGAALTSLKWSLTRLDKDYTEEVNSVGNGNARRKIEEMVGLVDATINTVRRISSELRPGVLDDLGLISAIEWHAHQFQANTGILCRFDSQIENVDLSRAQATTVFRIFQEAMTNILRHAQATKVNILIEEEEDEFVLEVSDNGRGITESEKLGTRSLGLLGMRERAHSIGGRVEINGASGKGTTLIVRLPLQVNGTS